MRKDGILAGKSFTMRGEKRYALTMWQFVAIACVGITLFISYRDGEVMKNLAVQQYIVYEVDRRGNVTVHSAEEYQIAPLQVEIEGMAMNTTRWIKQAGSSDVETARTEAVKNMSRDMTRDFEAKMGDDWVEKIKKLNIYRKGTIFARQLKVEDLPAEERSRARITKYDVVVYGTVQTYRRGNNELLDESNFATRVTLNPLEARTSDKTSGLEVDLMTELDPKQVMDLKPAAANPPNAPKPEKTLR